MEKINLNKITISVFNQLIEKPLFDSDFELSFFLIDIHGFVNKNGWFVVWKLADSIYKTFLPQPNISNFLKKDYLVEQVFDKLIIQNSWLIYSFAENYEKYLQISPRKITTIFTIKNNKNLSKMQSEYIFENGITKEEISIFDKHEETKKWFKKYEDFYNQNEKRQIFIGK